MMLAIALAVQHFYMFMFMNVCVWLWLDSILVFFFLDLQCYPCYFSIVSWTTFSHLSQLYF